MWDARTALPCLLLEHAQEHCQPPHCIPTPDDDRLVKRFAELVRDFAEKLELELRVAAEHGGERAHLESVQRHRCHRLGGVHVVTALGQTEDVVGKQERHDASLPARQIAK